MDIVRTLRDPQLFGSAFAGDSWIPWAHFLRSLFALTPDAGADELYRQCTGRTEWPTEPFREAFVIAGRRSGKTRIAAAISVYIACLLDHSKHLSPGERGVVLCLAQDRPTAKVLLGYVRALLTGNPMLASMVAAERSESLELTNGIVIEVGTSDYRSVRGRTMVAAVCDESAFWLSSSTASPDTEVFAALRPALATVPESLLLAISSPYARRGELFRAFNEHWGNNSSPVLVWKAPTRLMNPTLPARVIADAFQRDAVAAASEWDAEFRSDLSSAFDEQVVAHAVDRGVSVRARTLMNSTGAHLHYVAFADPAGGAGGDSYTVAVAHLERDQAVLDALLEIRPPFSTDDASLHVAELLKSYGLASVTGDRYAGDWPAQALAKHGIGYVASDRDRSALYVEAVPLFSSGRVRLLDIDRLSIQLRQLERRSGRGRDVIDHPRGAHDDLANAACGALVRAARRLSTGQSNVTAEYSTLLDGLAGPIAHSWVNPADRRPDDPLWDRLQADLNF